jgi:HlyD family secretion protein
MTGPRRMADVARTRGLLVAAVLVAAVAGACGAPERAASPPTPVRVQPAEVATARDVLRYAATIQPFSQTSLAFKVGGYVAEILQVVELGGQRRSVQKGDRVSAGTVLARIQQVDYQVQVASARSQLRDSEAGRHKAEAQVRSAEAARPQAAAQLRDAEAGKSRAQAQLASAQASLDKAQRDFTRARNLYDVQSMTRADFDAARAALDNAQSHRGARRFA